MSLVTTAEVIAAGADGGLDATTLQAIIDTEEAAIVASFGAHYTGASVTERVAGGGRSLFLRRRLTSVSAVAEYAFITDTSTTTLTTDDYYVWADEGRIEKAWGQWWPLVSVTYIPVDDTTLRKQVLTELVRIATTITPTSGASVSGLSFSISGGGAAQQPASALRAQHLARLGWLS